MNQIDLFKQGQNSNTNTNKVQIQQNDSQNNDRKNSPSRMNAKRPDKIQIQKNIAISERWKECKVIGKNISIRSYSSSCAYNKKLYVYGGYQILKGMMNDFYCIDLDEKLDKFTWEQIDGNGDLPGPRSKHALIAGKKYIYLVGGLISDVQSSNQIYQYHPIKNTWTLLKPQGQKLPQIDTFGCVYLTSGEEEKIIVICGYDGKNAEYLNSVYEYNITKNKLSILFKGTKAEQKNENVPIPRSGCAAATDGKNVYIFGGKDSENRLNDLWEFSLTDFKYKKLQAQGDIPPKRNGHSMQYFEGKLYVFGGIHDITWELDDLHIYNIAKHKWTTLQQDSPRKVDRKKNTIQGNSKDKNERKSISKKKNWNQTVNTILTNNKSYRGESPTNKNKRQDEAGSPVKMIDEQRKKAFLQKKNDMLKNFQVTKDETPNYVKLQAQSQAIKNTLDVIGELDPKQKSPQGKLTQFGKQSTSKFLQPLTNNKNLVIGKKPCARDGHCATILNEELIIFSGDRHQMSFNDIYKLDFNFVPKNIGE